MGKAVIHIILLLVLSSCARVIEPPTHCVRYWVEKQGDMVVLDELRSPDPHCQASREENITASPSIAGFLGDTFKLITSLIPI